LLYRFGDLLLSSEIPFSLLPRVPEGTPECSFRRPFESDAGSFDGPWDHHWRSVAGDVALSCSRAGARYRLDLPSLGTFSIDDDGASISCRLRGAPSPETVEHGVVDQVLPRILVHRGRLVLHAGAIEMPDGAIAFIGDSGRGKSTLCAAFAAAGYPVLGDDGLVVRGCEPGGFEALSTYPGLRLLPEPLAFVFGSEAKGTPVAAGALKQRLPATTNGFVHCEKPVPLRAIYQLDDGPRIAIEPMTGPDAFLTLVRSTYHLHLGDARRSAVLFEQLAALLDTVPLRRLAYPRRLSLLPAVRDAVLGA
jgi:hypothetical protein